MAQSAEHNRAAGAAMIAAAAGMILAMGHHPSGPHGGALGGIVHGAMIAFLMLLAWGFLMFALDRGPGRPLVAAGLITYAVSLFAHIGAGTINGFVVPTLAGPEGPAVGHDIFRLAWRSNQALAQLGVFTTGAAYILWSIDLLRIRSGIARLTAALGAAAGAVPAVLLASGALRMDVSGAFLIYAMHAGWAAFAGAMLWRGALRAEEYSAAS